MTFVGGRGRGGAGGRSGEHTEAGAEGEAAATLTVSCSPRVGSQLSRAARLSRWSQQPQSGYTGR